MEIFLFWILIGIFDNSGNSYILFLLNFIDNYKVLDFCDMWRRIIYKIKGVYLLF